jgi:hypothetical protein
MASTAIRTILDSLSSLQRNDVYLFMPQQRRYLGAVLDDRDKIRS